MKNIVILLAAGKGSRMGTKTQKQFLQLNNKPLLYYSLKTFEQSVLIDEVVLVTTKEHINYVKNEIIDLYHFTKVKNIIPGGNERYLSVWNGLQTIKNQQGYVFIHDSARAFLTEATIQRAYDCVKEHRACVVGVPSKDTVKISDAREYVESTPKRERVWIIQTPQVFSIEVAYQAYEKLIEKDVQDVTDDAMVVEQTLHVPVKLTMGSYENIKITTPEDMEMAEVLVKKWEKVSKPVD